MAELDSNHAFELVIATELDAGGDPVIVLSGELDIASAGSLEQTVSSVTADGVKRLVFDLKDLRFMDSAGIAVLVGATKKVDQVNLRDPSPIVQRVLELTGLADVLPLVP